MPILQITNIKIAIDTLAEIERAVVKATREGKFPVIYETPGTLEPGVAPEALILDRIGNAVRIYCAELNFDAVQKDE